MHPTLLLLLQGICRLSFKAQRGQDISSCQRRWFLLSLSQAWVILFFFTMSLASSRPVFHHHIFLQEIHLLGLLQDLLFVCSLNTDSQKKKSSNSISHRCSELCGAVFSAWVKGYFHITQTLCSTVSSTFFACPVDGLAERII